MLGLRFIILFFLIVSIGIPGTARAHLVNYQYQNYSDSQQTTIQSQILQYQNNFYFFKDPTYLSHTRFQYRYDRFHLTDDGLNQAHGFNTSLTQGIAKSSRVSMNFGYNFDRETHLWMIGGAFEQGFNNDNTSVALSTNRVSGKKAVETFLNRELIPVTTSEQQEGMDYALSVTQIFTKKTVGRLGLRYVGRVDQTDAMVSSARLHQWLPTRGSFQGEYSYFFNVGNVPSGSQLGKLNAHILNLGVFHYVGASTTLGLTYRFYRETEQVESSFSNILGSDLYGIKLTHDLFYDEVRIEANLQRYLNNQSNQAWIASLGTNLSF